MRYFPLEALCAALLLLASADRAASQALPGDPNGSEPRGPLSIGAAAGMLYTNFYLTPIYAPQQLHVIPSFIVVADGEYRAYQFASLPLLFEAEVNVAKRWGAAHEFEFLVARTALAVLPMERHHLHESARIAVWPVLRHRDLDMGAREQRQWPWIEFSAIGRN